MTADADIFIDAAGAESVLDTFMKIGKIGSRFVAVAVNNALKQLNILHLTYAQKSIIGSGCYMPEDVNDVISHSWKAGVYNIDYSSHMNFHLMKYQKQLKPPQIPNTH